MLDWEGVGYLDGIIKKQSLWWRHSGLLVKKKLSPGLKNWESAGGKIGSNIENN